MISNSLQIVRLDDKHVVINNEMIINLDIAAVYKDGDEYIVFEQCGCKYYIEMSSQRERDETWNAVITDFFGERKSSDRSENLRKYLEQ